jgi:hypothetical protein
MWGALSDQTAGLKLARTIASAPCQSSHSLVPKPQNLHHILLSHTLLRKPGGPGSSIYIPHQQGDPVIPPDSGFPFRHLLRLVELRWSYSSPPPHGKTNN